MHHVGVQSDMSLIIPTNYDFLAHAIKEHMVTTTHLLCSWHCRICKLCLTGLDWPSVRFNLNDSQIFDLPSQDSKFLRNPFLVNTNQQLRFIRGTRASTKTDQSLKF